MPEGTPATGKAKLYEDQTKVSSITRADLGLLTLSCVNNPGCANKIFHTEDISLPMPKY